MFSNAMYIIRKTLRMNANVNISRPRINETLYINIAEMEHAASALIIPIENWFALIPEYGRWDDLKCLQSERFREQAVAMIDAALL